MANYNKSFNFRNGVQVDSDNFIVNASGAVGIGTSIPTATFDLYGGSKLRGDVNITGLVTSTQAYVSGVSTFNDVRIGTGITIEASSGIITATKFYGDGSTLDNVTSIAVSGWEINAGLAGTTSSVGIGTTNPATKLQVWDSVATSYTPNANISNLVTIYNVDKTKNDTFAGLTLGSLNTVEQLAVYNIACVSEATARKGSLIIQSRNTDDTYTEKLRISPEGYVGIGTTAPGQPVDVIGKLRTEELAVTKTSSFEQHVGFNTGLTVTGVATFSDDVKVSGMTTIGGNLHVSGNSDFGGTINLGLDAGDKVNLVGRIYSHIVPVNTGIDLGQSGANRFGDAYVSTLNVLGVSTLSGNVTTKNITAGGGYIGVNTAGISTVSIGQSVGVGKSTGVLRFGSADRTFEVLNNDIGDFVFGLHSGSVAGINTGDFKWNTRTTNNLMTLTGIGGSLGINQEDPIHPLHVGGSSTITGNAWFGADLNVKSNINCDGVITGSFTLQNPITSNVNSTGISTVGGLHIVGGSTNTLGVGTYTVTAGAKVEVQGGAVFPDTGVGINTNKVDSEFPLSVRGNMKVKKLTGWTKEGVNSGGVTLQHDHTDILTVVGTGVTIVGVTTITSTGVNVSGIVTATGGFISSPDDANPVKITVSGTTLTFTVGTKSASLTLS